MNKILIVVPRYNEKDKESYGMSLPLSLAYISAYLKKHQYSVDCINLNHTDKSLDQVLTKDYLKNYQYVLTNVTLINFRGVKDIIPIVRKESDCKIVIGGILVTQEPDIVFDNLKPDYGVIGEGEKTIIELLGALELNSDLNNIDGIIYSLNGKLIKTKDRKLIEDISELPFPDYDSVGIKKYLDDSYCGYWWKSYFDYPRVYEILTSRSCPYKCTFCYHATPYRERSISNVIEELRENIEKYKINIILIHDDCLTINKDRTLLFCKEIKNLISEFDWEIKWICKMRADVGVTSELLKIMKDAGCISINLGFESYNQGILNSMKKGITKKQIDNALECCLDVEMGLCSNLIFGDPAETLESADETLEWFKRNAKGQVILNMIVPCPKSEIFNYCIKNNIIKDKQEYLTNFSWSETLLNMTQLSDSDFTRLHKKMVLYSYKYRGYSIPKIKRNENRYSLDVKCPFCKENISYNNCKIEDEKNFFIEVMCRKCLKTFYMVSFLRMLGYKFLGASSYRFLRSVYLKLRKNKVIDELRVSK